MQKKKIELYLISWIILIQVAASNFLRMKWWCFHTRHTPWSDSLSRTSFQSLDKHFPSCWSHSPYWYGAEYRWSPWPRQCRQWTSTGRIGQWRQSQSVAGKWCCRTCASWRHRRQAWPVSTRRTWLQRRQTTRLRIWCCSPPWSAYLCPVWARCFQLDIRLFSRKERPLN